MTDNRGIDTPSPAGSRGVLDLADHELVTRIRAGDGALYGDLFRAYWESLCRVAMYLVHDADDAREIVAKVFAVLWERRSTWTVTATVEAYLFGAVRNEARHVHRDVARRSDLLRAHVQDDPNEASLHGDPLVHGAAAGDAIDLEMTLDRAVRELPERYQLAIHLRWRRGMDYQEIGEVLGTGADAARMVITRALSMLRRQLPDA